MNTRDTSITEGVIDYTRRFDEYKQTVNRLFPALARDYVDTRSISEVDALALGHFLECYPRRVVVLDVGTFVGASALHFASQPKVLKVIGIDSNPPLADEVEDKPGMLGSTNSEPLQNLRVLDVAQAALAEFGDEQQKIQLYTGAVGNGQGGIRGETLEGLAKVEMPASEPSDSASLMAFVGGLQTKEGAQANLEAVFEKAPRAVVILDDCRGSRGPFVQAGVVDFMGTAQKKYHFRLFGDLGPSIATSDLGIVYPDIDAGEVEETLAEFSELFSERLDLLRLLRREEELINAVSWYKNKADRLRDRLRKRNSQVREMRERNSRPRAQNSQLIPPSVWHRKLAGTLSKGALRVPVIQKLVRSKRST